MKKIMKYLITKSISLMVVFVYAFAFIGNTQCILLNEPFDANPALSATNVDGAWYPDRYRPAAFVSDVLSGSNVLKISIDGINDGAMSRPSGYSSSFYNTQGRKFNQCGKCVTVLKGDLWIPSDWATNHRRSDMWATAYNAANSISAYPIIGFRNPDGTSPGIYCYDVNTGFWINSGVSISYDNWYSLEFRLSGTDLEYLVNNSVVLTLSSGGSTYFGDIIMQAYNFNDPALPTVNQSADSYDAYWDNLITTGTGGNVVTNTNTGETFCSIQGAIDDAQTLDGHTITVSAGIYKEQVNINKGITLIGDVSNPDNAIIDGENKTTLPSDGQIRIYNPTGDVVFKGFKIINYGIFNDNIYLAILTKGNFSKTIQNCKIVGHGSSLDPGWDYGLWAYTANGELTVKDNYFGEMYHAVLLEQQYGAATIEGNTFDNLLTAYYAPLLGNVGGRAIEAIIYGPTDVTSLQKVSGNTFTNFKSTGVLFSGGFDGQIPRKFTNVLIENNNFDFAATDIVNYQGAISLKNVSTPANDNSNGGVTSDIFNNYINVPSGNGIQVSGLNGNINCNNNYIVGSPYGLKANTSLGPIINATCNWWGSNVHATIATKINGTVNYLPWLISGVDASADIGFQPTGNCTANCMLTLSTTTTETCLSKSTGTATVNVTGGGTGSYTYLWSPGGQTTQTATGLAMGIYNVTVTDMNGCNAMASATVSAGADSDCDGVGDACDVCPGGNDKVDNDNNGLPDCKYPPAYNKIISAWKCGNNKVYVAHGTGNGGCNTLCISYNAVQAHVNHGDYIGSCNHAKCSEGLLQGNDRMYSLSGEHVMNEYRNQFGSHDGEMELYPNPVHDILYVKLMVNTHSSASVQIQLLNNMGQQLFNQKYANSQDDETIFPVNTQAYSNGLYFIKVTVDGTEHVKTFTVLK